MGHEAIVVALLERGAEVNATYLTGGNTPLHLAARNSYASVCAALMKGGANTKARTQEVLSGLRWLHGGGKTPLECARDMQTRVVLRGKHGTLKELANKVYHACFVAAVVALVAWVLKTTRG